MSTLARKIQQAREKWLELEGYSLLIRRPTALWIVGWRSRGAEEDELLRHVIIDWKGIKEADLLGSGGTEPLDFDKDACLEFVGDRVDDLNKLVDFVKTEIDKAGARAAEQEKN